jgi:hypothetical protein
MAEFEKYERRQNALGAKLGKNDPALARARQQTLKARKKLKEVEKKVEAAETRAKAADEASLRSRQLNRDLAKSMIRIFEDMHQGKPEADVKAMVAQKIGLSIEQLNEITSD